MEEKKHLVGGISRKTLERLPVYHHYLERRDCEGLVNISAPVIALDLQLNEVQVRKDIAMVARSAGKPSSTRGGTTGAAHRSSIVPAGKNRPISSSCRGGTRSTRGRLEDGFS